jgi:ankyrin repeat protein
MEGGSGPEKGTKERCSDPVGEEHLISSPRLGSDSPRKRAGPLSPASPQAAPHRHGSVSLISHASRTLQRLVRGTSEPPTTTGSTCTAETHNEGELTVDERPSTASGGGDGGGGDGDGGGGGGGGGRIADQRVPSATSCPTQPSVALDSRERVPGSSTLHTQSPVRHSETQPTQATPQQQSRQQRSSHSRWRASGRHHRKSGALQESGGSDGRSARHSGGSKGDPRTLLRRAIRHRDLNGARVALQSGARANGRDEERTPPLHLCAEQEDHSKKQPQEAEESDREQAAAVFGALGTLLLEGGADPCVCGRRLENALHRAAWYGALSLTQAILRWQARSAEAERLVRAALGARNKHGATPLHLAAFGGHLTVTRAFLGAGAEVDARTKRGNTPLHRASSAGHHAVVQLLLQRGADPSLRNSRGLVAHLASSSYVRTGAGAAADDDDDDDDGEEEEEEEEGDAGDDCGDATNEESRERKVAAQATPPYAPPIQLQRAEAAPSHPRLLSHRPKPSGPTPNARRQYVVSKGRTILGQYAERLRELEQVLEVERERVTHAQGQGQAHLQVESASSSATSSFSNESVPRVHTGEFGLDLDEVDSFGYVPSTVELTGSTDSLRLSVQLDLSDSGSESDGGSVDSASEKGEEVGAAGEGERCADLTFAGAATLGAGVGTYFSDAAAVVADQPSVAVTKSGLLENSGLSGLSSGVEAYGSDSSGFDAGYIEPVSEGELTEVDGWAELGGVTCALPPARARASGERVGSAQRQAHSRYGRHPTRYPHKRSRATDVEEESVATLADAEEQAFAEWRHADEQEDVNEESSRSSTDDWNTRYQSILASFHSLDVNSLTEKRIAINQQVLQLSRDFVFCAKAYGKIIISELYLRDCQKTIKPTQDMPGVAGGAKYIVENIL